MLYVVWLTVCINGLVNSSDKKGINCLIVTTVVANAPGIYENIYQATTILLH